MKSVKIKYNPYTITTEILIDGKQPKSNSPLHFGKMRLQEWAGNLPELLIKDCSDENFNVEFTGTINDFEDLKIAFEAKKNVVNVSNYRHNRKPDVAETEAEVEKIFREILAGPVEKLKDISIINDFKKAKDQEFEINVVATMSSGKSTLINALLDKKLMPVANLATTATIVRITDTEQDNYSGIAYDSSGKKILEEDNLTYQIMKEWNKNERISTIDIKGRIPAVKSSGMKLVLVDTPGPNNSGDSRHKEMTYKMLNDSDKSLVLFVMNGSQLEINDEQDFLTYVCDCMNKGGKQSRERFIFAVNKMDMFNPEEESIDEALQKVKNFLEARKIFDPNIFPVSSQAALEVRTKPLPAVVLSYFKEWIKLYQSHHFESYYNYSHLPHVVELKINRYLKEADEDTRVEVHSGIASIEEAIGLYIDKYARTMKVYDLVQSFNSHLEKLAAVAQLKEEIRHNTKKKEELEETIRVIRHKINSGQSAQSLSKLVEDINITTDVKTEIDNYIDKLRKRINIIINEYNNHSKVRKSEATSQAKTIENDCKDILAQLPAQIDRILSNTYIMLYKTIVRQYESFVKELGVSVGKNALAINPLVFVAEDIHDLNTILNDNTSTKDEGGNQYVTEKESYQVKVKDSKWWNPFTWGDYHYETRYRDKTIQKWVSKYVDYVNMSEVVNEYFEPLQVTLTDAQSAALEHVISETDRIKKNLKNQLQEINRVLAVKLTELEESINDVNETEKEIKAKQENLKWMNGIIDRVNKLIKF